MKIKFKNRHILLIAIALYIPLGFLQVSIDYRRKLEDLEGQLILMPGQAAGSLVLSGFRGIAADLLWLQVEDLWHKGHHFKILPLVDAVTWLQPQYITPWAIGGWHMAYNIFAAVREQEFHLKSMLDQQEAELTDQDDESLHEAAAIARLGHGMINHTDGMTEKEIPAMRAKLERHKMRLSELQREKDTHPLFELAMTLVSIAHEQLFWYEQGVTLLKRGITYNRERYDLYFELGWTYYHKGQDYPNAVRYLEQAVNFPRPDFVRSILAHAYELNGQTDKALEQWHKQLDTGFQNIAERAIRQIKEDGAFTPKRRRALGLND